MLILVATPIGNLSDMTFRAVEALNSCDLILCEDTRHTLKLLNHYHIKKPLKAYHKFNEAAFLDDLVELLKKGKTVCLVSDAGTPLISDPGFKLVQRCVQEEIQVTAIPGACAAIQALVLSGIETEKFQFIGFLPKAKNALKQLFLELLNYSGVSICYESPERLDATLEILSQISPETQIAIARELTKKFEEVIRGNAAAVFQKIKEKKIKGEIVLLIHGEKEKIDFSSLSLEEHVVQVQSQYGVSQKDAIKIVAELRNEPKRNIYNKIKR